MLESKADLTTGLGRRFNCVSLHGSLTNLECHLCHKAYEWEDYRGIIEGHNMKDELTLPEATTEGKHTVDMKYEMISWFQ